MKQLTAFVALLAFSTFFGCADNSPPDEDSPWVEAADWPERERIHDPKAKLQGHAITTESKGGWTIRTSAKPANRAAERKTDLAMSEDRAVKKEAIAKLAARAPSSARPSPAGPTTPGPTAPGAPRCCRQRMWRGLSGVSGAQTEAGLNSATAEFTAPSPPVHQ